MRLWQEHGIIGDCWLIRTCVEPANSFVRKGLEHIMAKPCAGCLTWMRSHSHASRQEPADRSSLEPFAAGIRRRLLADYGGGEQGKTVFGDKVWGLMWVVAQEHCPYRVCPQTIAGKGAFVPGRQVRKMGPISSASTLVCLPLMLFSLAIALSWSIPGWRLLSSISSSVILPMSYSCQR
jgi:hypothetical protein